MAVSVFDLFTIGIGPSSSHTVGPMRAARQFAHELQAAGNLNRVTRLRVHLYGSLAATGRGHGSHKALMLGLEGETAEETDVDRIPARVAAITKSRRLDPLRRQAIPFSPDNDLVFERRGSLPGHPNGMRFVALAGPDVVAERIYYSVGGGFVATAAGLTEVLGGSPAQVENAAEIGMEHNLGLTCDPVGGLVQIPCIERNAMASVEAINASRLALRGTGRYFVSLDKVIRTMRDTGRDMQEKYKETSRGGLAMHVVSVPVSIIEC